MTPLVLTMQAFGPFAAEETINFSQLGRSPLFLINGPTGAGEKLDSGRHLLRALWPDHGRRTLGHPDALRPGSRYVAN